MDLIEFLRAQINIDERRAIDQLFYMTEDTDSVRSPGWYEARCAVFDCDWYTTGTEPVVEDAAWEHVGREHRDDRSLREVEAKRRILDLYDVSTDRNLAPDGWELMKHAVRALALPYADHPDYRPEWRP